MSPGLGQENSRNGFGVQGASTRSIVRWIRSIVRWILKEDPLAMTGNRAYSRLYGAHLFRLVFNRRLYPKSTADEMGVFLYNECAGTGLQELTCIALRKA